MKKIICLILALVMMMSMSLFLISCGDDNNGGDDENGNGNNNQTDTKVTYTVTVTDDSGKPVKDVIVNMTTKGGTPMPYPTDSEGKITYVTAKELTATVTIIPTGYEYDKIGVAQTFDANGNLSIVLTAKEQGKPYVIKVVDENGEAISGVKVQMCDVAGSCRTPKTTDANGQVEYDHEDGTFRAQLTALPEGYTVDDPSQYYDFVDGVATIVLTSIK